MTTTSARAMSLNTPPPSDSDNAAAGAAASSKTKLHGRAFYESIGKPRLVLAPMVDQSEFAWRLLSRSFMPPSSKDLVAYTPMFHARLFSETPKFRDHHFQPLRSSLTEKHDSSTIDSSAVFLDGNSTLDRPLFTQFCANDPDELLGAARYVAPFCDAVDLNLGCPQGIAKKGKYGAFLQEDQDLIYQLINKLHIHLDIPVTAKIRILETKEKTLAYARNVLAAGASILTVHGRQRDQKGHKTGLADWKMIRYLRENLPKETVLFANGNILRREDIDQCLEETGADGVMSAEGNLYNPAIFAEAPKIGEEGREFWRGRDGSGGWRMDAVLRRYMDIIYRYVLEVPLPERTPLYLPSDSEAPPAVSNGKHSDETEDDDGPPKKKQKTDSKSEQKPADKKEKATSPNLLAMQPHFFRLLRPLVAKHHPVRDALAKCRAGDIAAFENVLQMVEAVVKRGLKEYEDTDGESWAEELRNDERLAAAKSATQVKGNAVDAAEGEEGNDEDEEYLKSLEMVKACKRPWWVVQPYVRPLPKEALAKGSLTLSKKEKERLQVEAKEKEKDKKGDGKEIVGSGYTVQEKVEGGKEAIEIPKDGLVCG